MDDSIRQLLAMSDVAKAEAFRNLVENIELLARNYAHTDRAQDTLAIIADMTAKGLRGEFNA
jgi:hypothetical protein